MLRPIPPQRVSHNPRPWPAPLRPTCRSRALAIASIPVVAPVLPGAQTRAWDPEDRVVEPEEGVPIRRSAWDVAGDDCT
jgi:hypothetical protein